MRLFLLTLAAVLAMSAGVLYASHAQRATADLHQHESMVADDILSALRLADAGISTYALTGDRVALTDHDQAVEQLRQDLGEAADLSLDDPQEHAAVLRQQRLVAQVSALTAAALQRPGQADRIRALREDAGRRRTLLTEAARANATLQARQDVLARREDQRTSLTPALLILVLSMLFGGAAAVAARAGRRTAREAAARRTGQDRFGEAMQVSDSQTEAHRLLKAHLERSIPGGTITVLNRNNSADRLEAGTAIDDTSPLGLALHQARPRSCMAVRLSRPFSQGAGSDEVLACEVCGAAASDTTCRPLLVGGEVIGSVLVEHPGALPEGSERLIDDSVAQSAPVLANLRNLAIAETRAATDALTGLPNRRAVDDTLLRMLAQAGRSFDPLSVILLDLDHFKVINDTYGHDRGDEVLAAFSTRLREVLRTGDFAGRSGGEEFVIFLPDTDRTGAVRVAESLRHRMRDLSFRGVEHAITASFGIACFPDDANDAPTLMRSADRALYAAKNRGRDRIEASSTGAPPPASPDAVATGV